jgi:deoxyribose-phosphate aldolase
MASIASTIDHTLLKPDARAADIERLCAEAIEYNFHSVCVNSSRVAFAARLLAGSKIKIAAVTGFPLGAMSTEAKVHETHLAVRDGADEIDTVIAIGHLQDGETAYVLSDLKAVVSAAEEQPVKVILETSLLTHEEKILGCKLAVEAGAAFVKTSTGFAGGGATIEDVRLFRETVGSVCKVKASGGIRDAATALAMLEAGADRLGTSAGVAILTGLASQGEY